MKNVKTICIIFALVSSCSSSGDSQGVISKNDLSNETTVTTIKEEVVQEIISPEDAQFLLARCLRDKGYDINDPKNGESLRSVLQPVFLATDQKGREELFEYNSDMCGRKQYSTWQ